MRTAPEATQTDEMPWLQAVLTGRIPLGAAMQLTVARLDRTGVELRAPLAPNLNDKGTAFGGALASMLILAGWSLPRLLLRRAGLAAELVIGRCELRFLEPVRGEFSARCTWPGSGEQQQFIDHLNRTGRSRLLLSPEITVGDRVAAKLEARYAALRTPTLQESKRDEPVHV